MAIQKTCIVLLIYIATVVCVQNNTNAVLEEEARARKKKSKPQVWAILGMLMIAKLAVSKLASLLLLWGFFQKFCYFLGLLINYFMLSKRTPEQSPESPASVTPDYNTIGYSYGAPSVLETAGISLPDSTYGAPYKNWPYSKRSKEL